MRYLKLAAVLYIATLAGCAPRYGDGTRAGFTQLSPDRCDSDYCNMGKVPR